MPQAKVFQRWITHEVLPTIRKTGGYIHGAEEMSDKEVLIRAFEIRDEQLKQAKKEIQERDIKIKELEPKTEVADKILVSKLEIIFR